MVCLKITICSNRDPVIACFLPAHKVSYSLVQPAILQQPEPLLNPQEERAYNCLTNNREKSERMLDSDFEHCGTVGVQLL